MRRVLLTAVAVAPLLALIGRRGGGGVPDGPGPAAPTRRRHCTITPTAARVAPNSRRRRRDPEQQQQRHGRHRRHDLQHRRQQLGRHPGPGRPHRQHRQPGLHLAADELHADRPQQRPASSTAPSPPAPTGSASRWSAGVLTGARSTTPATITIAGRQLDRHLRSRTASITGDLTDDGTIAVLGNNTIGDQPRRRGRRQRHDRRRDHRRRRRRAGPRHQRADRRRVDDRLVDLAPPAIARPRRRPRPRSWAT